MVSWLVVILILMVYCYFSRIFCDQLGTVSKFSVLQTAGFLSFLLWIQVSIFVGEQLYWRVEMPFKVSAS